VHALDKNQFRKYAGGQVTMAEQMLAGHQPGAGGYCSCGKQLPCSVAEHAAATRDHYLGKLALLDATVLLPVLATAAAGQGEQLPMWRRWLRSWR
jgi:hypothetical protein